MRRRQFLQNSLLAYSAAQTPPLTAEKPLLQQKIEEAIYAFVVADAMGGSVENNVPEATKAKFKDWDFNNFLPPTAKKDLETGLGKGNGRTTDDTLNLEALIGCYLHHRDHLDAYSYANHWLKEITEKKVWIAEKGAEMIPNDRPLWWPERYVYQRLAINNAEPRTAGVGNWINEGFQGIVLPVGAVNAGDPWAAYREVAAFGMAHTESFGVEGAAVNAAAYAAAFQVNSTVESILEAALRYAQDGTKLAIEDALKVTRQADDLDTFILKTRKAFLPYLQLSPRIFEKSDNPETDKKLREATNIARPSRIGCIENVPIALAALKYGQGDYFKTMKASIFYGRDAESIAAVSTSLLAAMKGSNVVPQKLKKEVDAINRRDYARTAQELFEATKAIFEKDEKQLRNRRAVITGS
ncbi:MAG: ADP-ribosylglycohydrolase family protein [Spirosomaceae bacterium]|nr:ADP-ribosylglycohydrolase family protein [Spirosomataceae bacterium]